MRVLVIDGVLDRLHKIGELFNDDPDSNFTVCLSDYVSEEDTFDGYDVIIISASDVDFCELMLYYMKLSNPKVFDDTRVIAIFNFMSSIDLISLAEKSVKIYFCHAKSGSSLIITIEYLKNILPNLITHTK